MTYETVAYYGFGPAVIVAVVAILGVVKVLQHLETWENALRSWKAARTQEVIDERKRADVLTAGICKHMNAKGHDRCWLNDLELYRLVDPSVSSEKMALPCLPEFMHNCAAYWSERQPSCSKLFDKST